MKLSLLALADVLLLLPPLLLTTESEWLAAAAVVLRCSNSSAFKLLEEFELLFAPAVLSVLFKLDSDELLDEPGRPLTQRGQEGKMIFHSPVLR